MLDGITEVALEGCVETSL